MGELDVSGPGAAAFRGQPAVPVCPGLRGLLGSRTFSVKSGTAPCRLQCLVTLN